MPHKEYLKIACGIGAGIRRKKYIDISKKTNVKGREISDGVLLDYDDNDALMNIDIDNASKKVHLKELSLQKLPADIRVVALQLSHLHFL